MYRLPLPISVSPERTVASSSTAADLSLIRTVAVWFRMVSTVPVYTISENTLCTVTPQDQATIKITVDELDINSLSLGDEAQITLDALSGQRFTGTVSKINTTGTNSGGNAKYTVEVTIERNEHMLTGMNAAVNFVQKVTDDVVTIPAAALSESAGHVYVYTSYNEKED